MAISYSVGVGVFNDGSGTTLDAGSTISHSANDLIVGMCGWEDSDTTGTIDTVDSSFPLTMLTESNDGSNYIRLGWVQAGSAGTNKTWRLTTTDSVGYRHLIVMVFSVDADETVTKEDGGDGSSDNNGSGTSVSSNSISVTGSDILLVGAVKSYAYMAISNQQLAGGAADGSIETDGDMGSMWYKSFSEAQSNKNATATYSDTYAWVCDIVGFASAGVGGNGDGGGYNIIANYYKYLMQGYRYDERHGLYLPKIYSLGGIN